MVYVRSNKGKWIVVMLAMSGSSPGIQIRLWLAERCQYTLFAGSSDASDNGSLTAGLRVCLIEAISRFEATVIVSFLLVIVDPVLSRESGTKEERVWHDSGADDPNSLERISKSPCYKMKSHTYTYKRHLRQTFSLRGYSLQMPCPSRHRQSK